MVRLRQLPLLIKEGGIGISGGIIMMTIVVVVVGGGGGGGGVSPARCIISV